MFKMTTITLTIDGEVKTRHDPRGMQEFPRSATSTASRREGSVVAPVEAKGRERVCPSLLQDGMEVTTENESLPSRRANGAALPSRNHFCMFPR